MKQTFILAIFLSAFLLFSVEPLLAKQLIPLFGGSAFVWTACILFFQTGLLAGYAYAYVLAKYCKPKTQCYFHIGLLLISALFIPIHFYAITYVESLWPPFAVFILLAMSIALPFMVLSASSPLLQHWYCLVKHTEFPYYYYSISNAGSLLGLLGYILLIEPFIGIHRQALSWSTLFVIYIVLCLLCAKNLLSFKKSSPMIYKNMQDPTYQQVFCWIILTFLSSVLLLSTTQYLTQNVLNLPLTWVVPLALYLISYMVTFSNQKSYRREFWWIAFILCSAFTFWKIYQLSLNGFDAVLVILGLLYSSCMICQGELIRLKPSQQHLTLFYLMISLGGVLGALFANVVAVFFFTNWWDFYSPLIFIILLVTVLAFKQYQKSQQQFYVLMSVLSACTGIFICSMIYFDAYSPREKLVDQKRNLYGFLRVFDFRFKNPQNNVRVLMHGKIMHGLQFKAPAKQQWPTSYYGYRSGVALAMSFLREKEAHPLQIGVIGLGCGVMSTLGVKGEQLTFYEIDPDVVNFGQKYFTFLSQSLAHNHIVLGDARIQLEKSLSDPNSRYDLFAVDAFNGDAIPFHLLTQEAMDIYRGHLAQHGILAIHITNSYLDLVPIIKALAKQQRCEYFVIDSFPDPENNISYSRWALISCHPDLKAWLMQQNMLEGFMLIPTESVKPILWTDDYNSILHVLRYE